MNDTGRLRVMYPGSLTPGGAERQQLLLAEHLPADRFDISFVVIGGMTDLVREADTIGATVHVLGAPRRKGVAMPIFAFRVAGRVLAYAALCRRERYDIVDAWLYHDYGLTAITRPMTSVPVFIAGRRSLGGFKAGFGPAERAVDALARRSADLIVANSQAVADDVARREGVDPSRIRVIRNGVVIPDQPTDDVRRAARATMGISDDAPVVGYVGMFRSGKGQAGVVEAMALARPEVRDAWLVLIGDGPERASVERQVAELGLEKVIITGTVLDARSLYPGLDVVISASDAEGLPNVILEAAAAGRPIVATDAGGTSEVVIDGKTGILVGVRDTAALAKGLTTLVTDRDLAVRLGAVAREWVTRTFGLDRFVRETAALYEELHGRRIASRGIAAGIARAAAFAEAHRPTTGSGE